MSERRNLCHEAGCTPAPSCCHDMSLTLTSDELLHFPENIPISSLKILDDGRGPFVANIEGDCPNLKDKACAIYENRPQACRQTSIGEKTCTEYRLRDNKLPTKLGPQY